MNRPIRHHYIPKVVLRNFADDKSAVYFCRAEFQRGEVRKTNIDNLFVESHLNTATRLNGTRDFSLESFFSKIESLGAEFFRQLLPAVRAGKTIRMNDTSRQFWNMFFYFQMKRHPKIMERLGMRADAEARISQAIADSEQESSPFTPEEFERFASAEGREDLLRNALVQARGARPTQELVQAMESTGLLAIYIPNPRKSFVIGDRAIVRFDTRGNLSSRLGDPASMSLFPVAPDVAITPHGEPSGTLKVYNADPEDVRHINELMFIQSEIVASRSKELLASLSRARPTAERNDVS